MNKKKPKQAEIIKPKKIEEKKEILKNEEKISPENIISNDVDASGITDKMSTKEFQNLDFTLENEENLIKQKNSKQNRYNLRAYGSKKRQYMTRREVTEARIVNNILNSNNPAGQANFDDLFIMGNKYVPGND